MDVLGCVSWKERFGDDTFTDNGEFSVGTTAGGGQGGREMDESEIKELV